MFVFTLHTDKPDEPNVRGTFPSIRAALKEWDKEFDSECERPYRLTVIQRTENGHLRRVVDIDRAAKVRVRTSVELRPQTNQTESQRGIEILVAVADSAYAGLKVPAKEEVPEAVKAELLNFAGMMAYYVGPPRVLRLPEGQSCVGVPLTRTRSPQDGSPYVMALITHVPIRPAPEHSGELLVDGHEPGPCRCLDGWRFTAAYAGLLRLLEREVRALRAGDDWNWNDGSDPAFPADDEDWHPTEMLLHVTRMRLEAQRTLMVDEVQER